MHDFFEDLRQFAESALGIPEGMQEVLENALRSGDIQAKRLLQERVELRGLRHLSLPAAGRACLARLGSDLRRRFGTGQHAIDRRIVRRPWAFLRAQVN